MRYTQNQLIKRLLLVMFFLINTQFKKSLSLENKTSEYSVLKMYKNNILNQKQMALTYKLELQPQSIDNQKHLIIEINQIQLQSQQSKLMACLNFDEDILKDKKILSTSEYYCQTDNNKEMQQFQYLMIFELKEHIQIYRTAYLTFIELTHTEETINLEEQLSKKLSFTPFIYYSNFKPCYQNCNGNHGICNKITGQCICYKNFYGIDCSIQTQELNFNNNYDAFSFSIFPKNVYYFKIDVTNIIQNPEVNDVSIFLEKLKGNQNIQILASKDQLPSFDHNEFNLTMDFQEIKLPSFKKICPNLIGSNKSNNTLVGKQQNNSTYLNNNCFLIIQISQTSSLDYTLLKFSLSIEENKNIQINNSKNDQQNQKLNTTNTIKNQMGSVTESEKKENLFIIIINALFIFLIIIILLFKCKRSQTPLINAVLQNENTNLHEINQNIQLEQINKKFVSQIRLLQDKLNPIIIIHFPKSQNQSIQEIDQSKNNNSENQNNFIQRKSTLLYPEYNQNEKQQQFTQNFGIKPNCLEAYERDIKECKQIYFQEKNEQQIICQKFQNQFNQLEQQQPNQKTQSSILKSSSQQCCAICLTEFINEEKARKTICNHIFHIDCLSSWLDKNHNCPLCRQSFEIMDMIDYLAIDLCKTKIKCSEKDLVINERNKIKSILENNNNNNEIFNKSDQQFFNIFSYFFPQNQIYSFTKHNQDNTPSKISPFLNSFIYTSQPCDKSSIRLLSDNINNYKVNANSSKPTNNQINNNQMNFSQDESQKSEAQYSNDLFKNLDHLKIDEIIEDENKLNQFDLCYSLENTNQQNNKLPKTINDINFDLNITFQQKKRSKCLNNVLNERIITIPQLFTL